LDHNRLSGNVPSKFTALTKLSVFTLNSNKMTGPVPAGLSVLDSANGGKLTKFDTCANFASFATLPTGFTNSAQTC